MASQTVTASHWNIVPAGLRDVLGGDDEEGSQRAMRAMLQMSKLDIDELRRVYNAQPERIQK